MTIGEYIQWLYKIGMGWLGWKPKEVRECHLQELHLAYEGKIEMLKACYGGGDSKEDEKKNFQRVDTVEAFDKLFGAR
jgi:hypothetical protein